MLPNVFPHLVEAIEKTAAEKEEKPSRAKAVAKVVGGGLLAGAAGTLAGGTSAYLANKLYKSVKGRPIPAHKVLRIGVPLAGALLAPAYITMKLKEQREIQRALRGRDNKSRS